MIRALVIIRTSTVRQEIEAQKEEICVYARSFGYSTDEIVVIGDKGASAIKLNDLYKKNLDLVYRTIESTPSIEKVFAWSLDRIARKDNMLLEFKNFLIDHKVNLIIKNPSLSLFNDNGTVNSGIELAISLFATMAQQEMQLKQDRFMRAKKAGAAQGKFIGARYMLFGYTTNADGYLVIDPDEADIVKLIFDLYVTEEYSNMSLAKELNERGLRIRSKKFNEGHLTNILKNTAYIGYLERNTLFNEYPAIISKEQFEKVKEIRNRRNSNLDKSTKYVNYAVKILKCFECGSNYMRFSNSREVKYMCYKRLQARRYEESERCTTSCAVQAKVMDEILKDLAYILKQQNSEQISKTKLKELNEKNEILTQKIDNLTFELSHIKEKLAKIVDAYTDDVITKDQYLVRVERIKAEQNNLEVSLRSYKSDKKNIEAVLSNLSDPSVVINSFLKDRDSYFNDEDRPAIKEIINKYIKVAYPKAIQVNNTNLTVIMVVDYDDNIYNFIFQQKHGKREGLYRYSLENNKLKAYHTNTTKVDVMGIVTNNTIYPPASDAMLKIMDSSDHMEELRKQVEDLNEQVRKKL